MSSVSSEGFIEIEGMSSGEKRGIWLFYFEECLNFIFETTSSEAYSKKLRILVYKFLFKISYTPICFSLFISDFELNIFFQL